MMSTISQYKSITVSVDSFKDKVLSGKLFTAEEEDSAEFGSMMDLFIKTEDLLEKMEEPVSEDPVRSFLRDTEARTELDTTLRKMETGKIATFIIDIMFRQNTSWQGSVVWLEGKRKQVFRSALELAFLMNGALEEAEA